MRRAAALLVGLLALAGGALVVAAPPAAAEYVGVIEVDVTINADTTFDVVETIVYDFEYSYRHGIFRDIPIYDETTTGQRRNYGVTVTSVTVDGAPTPYVESFNGPFLNLRIGDPDVTINGPHTYVVEYTVSNGLRVVTAEDLADPAMPAGLEAGDVELYWDLVGSGWEVPLQSASSVVRGPGTALSAVCYYGPPGTTTRCPTAVDGAAAAYGPVHLSPGEALTAATVYPQEAFTATPVEDISQRLPSNPFLAIPIAIIPAVLLVVGPAVYAARKRKADAGVELPGAPPQYSPPDGLTAAELSVAWKGDEVGQRSRMLVATLVDLAARRWIDVGQADGKLQVTWRGVGRDVLRPWEQNLVGAILKGQPTAVLGGYDKDLSTLWTAATGQLEDAAEASGRRNPTGDKPDQRWTWLALLWVGFTGLGILLFFLGQGFAGMFALSLAAGAFVGFVTARIITPRKETQQSAEFQAKVRGLERVLGTEPAASRREFAQRLGLPPEAVFATMLPYAIVMKMEDAWMGAFPDLTPEQLSYFGFSTLGMASMNGLISSGTTSVSSAMTAPSSGSGGGGFSGGGGGGGGGGSW